MNFLSQKLHAYRLSLVWIRIWRSNWYLSIKLLLHIWHMKFLKPVWDNLQKYITLNGSFNKTSTLGCTASMSTKEWVILLSNVLIRQQGIVNSSILLWKSSLDLWSTIYESITGSPDVVFAWPTLSGYFNIEFFFEIYLCLSSPFMLKKNFPHPGTSHGNRSLSSECISLCIASLALVLKHLPHKSHLNLKPLRCMFTWSFSFLYAEK